MAMALSRRCMYVELHVTLPQPLLYIFPLINHTDSLRRRAPLSPSSITVQKSGFRFSQPPVYKNDSGVEMKK